MRTQCKHASIFKGATDYHDANGNQSPGTCRRSHPALTKGLKRYRVMSGVKFLVRMTLRRLDLANEIYYLREPQKIPLVMNQDEASAEKEGIVVDIIVFGYVPSSFRGCKYLPRSWFSMAQSQCRPYQPWSVKGDECPSCLMNCSTPV
ncbi:MAG: hypothetical protein GY761_12910 [Hyphomicrobiales bacterium]|nr:hypothetical protein [Hyphomicrobiales bacterium]